MAAKAMGIDGRMKGSQNSPAAVVTGIDAEGQAAARGRDNGRCLAVFGQTLVALAEAQTAPWVLLASATEHRLRQSGAVGTRQNTLHGGSVLVPKLDAESKI